MDISKKVVISQIEQLYCLFLDKLEILKEKEIHYNNKLLFLENLDDYYIHVENDTIEYGILCRSLGEDSIVEGYEFLLAEQCDILRDYESFWISITGLQKNTKTTLYCSYGIGYDRIELFAYKIELNKGKVEKLTLEREL